MTEEELKEIETDYKEHCGSLGLLEAVDFKTWAMRKIPKLIAEVRRLQKRQDKTLSWK